MPPTQTPLKPQVSRITPKTALPKLPMKAITNAPHASRWLPLTNPRHTLVPKMIPFFFPVKPARLAVPAHLVKSSLRVIPRVSAAIRALVSSGHIAVVDAIAAAATAVAVIGDPIVVDEATVVDAIAVAAPAVGRVDASNAAPAEARVTTVAGISVPVPRAVRNS